MGLSFSTGVKMLCIYDKAGNILSRSRNLRGIRTTVGKQLVESVGIQKRGDGSGVLFVIFANGDNFTTPFASYSVLCRSVLNWRNLYGAQLILNGLTAGMVGAYNEYLERDAC